MGKSLSIAVILFGGGAVSCGGNFILFFVLLLLGFGGSDQEITSGMYGFSVLGYLFIFWIIELFIILFYAIDKVSSQKNEISQDKKKIIPRETSHGLTLIVLMLAIFMCTSIIFGFISSIIDTSGLYGLEGFFIPLGTLVISVAIFIGIKNTTPSRIRNQTIPTNLPIVNTQKSETIDLMSSLAHADITDIESVQFIPIGTRGFIIKTSNIKRLTIYISEKLGKTRFAPEELRTIYTHVVNHIDSSIDMASYNLIVGKMDEFVKKGGEIIINRI